MAIQSTFLILLTSLTVLLAVASVPLSFLAVDRLLDRAGHGVSGAIVDGVLETSPALLGDSGWDVGGWLDFGFDFVGFDC